MFTNGKLLVNNDSLCPNFMRVGCRSVRMPRRLAIHTLLAIGVCISLVGCKSIKSIGSSSEETPGTTQGSEQVFPALGTTVQTEVPEAGTQPVVGGQGKVALVDSELGFIVVDFALSQMPGPEQKFYAYRNGSVVGEVITTGQADETFLVADINKGDIREGDIIRPE